MTALAVPRLRRPRVAALLGWSAAAVALALVIRALVAGAPAPRPAPAVLAGPSGSFHLAYPAASWHPVAVPGTVAALRRQDGRGLLIVREIRSVAGSAQSIATELTARLRATIPGFRPVSAKLVSLRSGRALLYTFVRDGGRAVQSLVVAPVGGRTWSMDVTAPAGARSAVTEAGRMIASFGA